MVLPGCANVVTRVSLNVISLSRIDDAMSEAGSVMSATDAPRARTNAGRASGGGNADTVASSGSKKRVKRSSADGDKTETPSKRARGNDTGGHDDDEAAGDDAGAVGSDQDIDQIDVKDEPQRYLLFDTSSMSEDPVTDNDTGTCASVAELPASLLALVDYWVRWLWLLYIRLQEEELWRQKSDALIVASSLDRRGGGVHGKKMKTPEDVMRVKNWSNIVLKANDMEPLTQLIQWAERRHIRSSRR